MKKLSIGFSLLPVFLFTLVAWQQVQAQAIVLSEIIIDPACSNDDCEFVEVKNRSDADVDISAWYVADDESGSNRWICTFPAGTTLSAGGTIIITKSTTAFATAYPSASCTVLGLDVSAGVTAGLANGGDRVDLFNSSNVSIQTYTWGNGVQRAEYQNNNTWITGAATEADPCFSALPIELSSFFVTLREKNTLLSFSTTSERNNSHFEIERSADGQTFAQIGRVAGAGNSDEVKNYTFTDKTPVAGVNYYRLKQVDFDGHAAYSLIRTVTFGKTGNLLLFPTPTTETLHLQLEKTFATDAPWQIMDMAGRVLTTGTLTGEQQTFQIPVNTLVAGAYLLRIVADQQLLTQQFSKQ